MYVLQMMVYKYSLRLRLSYRNKAPDIRLLVFAGSVISLVYIGQ